MDKYTEGVIIPDNDLKLNTSITASGVEIILYRLFDGILKIDLNQAEFGTEIFELNVENQKFFIRQQLYNNTSLNQTNPSSFKIKFSRLSEKTSGFPTNQNKFESRIFDRLCCY